MMPRFGRTSLAKLQGCHEDLQRVANLAIQKVDFSVKHGWRGELEQNELVRIGVSKQKWPFSDHNHVDPMHNPESLAMDVIPYPWDWGAMTYSDGKHLTPEGKRRFNLVIDAIQDAGDALGLVVRSGRDWQTFEDWPHLYLVIEQRET
jgi:peptidoglycan L-alanyl-D-glutamate endopeptidase CwlK